MRVRIIKPIGSAYGGFAVGTVANVPEKVARDWCNSGIAMQDKSLDGPTETKAEPIAEGNTGSRLENLRSKLGR